jgi:hypothetical protein
MAALAELRLTDGEVRRLDEAGEAPLIYLYRMYKTSSGERNAQCLRGEPFKS